jgi:hypothetical protein
LHHILSYFSENIVLWLLHLTLGFITLAQYELHVATNELLDLNWE